MNAPVFVSRQHASQNDNLSSGKCAGFSAGTRFDMDGYRRVFPDRWAAFLSAHFRDSTEVAFMFGVNDRTARNWMDGISAPRVEAVLALVEKYPFVLPMLLRDAA